MPGPLARPVSLLDVTSPWNPSLSLLPCLCRRLPNGLPNMQHMIPESEKKKKRNAGNTGRRPFVMPRENVRARAKGKGIGEGMLKGKSNVIGEGIARGCIITFTLQLKSRSFYPQRSSGQAVVTGVVPSPPRYVPSIFIAHRVQHSHCSSIFIECC